MEIKNHKEGTHEEEQCSISNIISSFCSENHNELNPLQEIFGAHSSSKPEDVTKNSDHEKHGEEQDEESYRMAKRQRSMEYRMMMEKVKMIFSFFSYVLPKLIYIFLSKLCRKDERRLTIK